MLGGRVGVEDDLADSSARRCRQTGREHGGRLIPFERRRIDARVQQLVQMRAGDAVDGLLLRDQALSHHIDCDMDGSRSGALAAAALEHEQAIVLDGELDVLHVLVVVFQTVARC